MSHIMIRKEKNKMKKIYLLPLLLLISSCTIITESSKEISKDENDNSSNEIITSSDEKSSSISIESSSVEIDSSSILSSEEIISSSIEKSLIESSEQSDTSSYGAGGHTANDVTNQEYYKSLVDRDQIHYSEPLINDPNHDVSALEIWQINDTHGAYVDGDDITGIAHVKTCINENTNDPYAAVKIANGDLLQGTAFSNLLLASLLKTFLEVILTLTESKIAASMKWILIVLLSEIMNLTGDLII